MSNPENLTIEIATEGDIPHVLSILKICKMFNDRTESRLKYCKTLLARTDGKVVGTRSFRRMRNGYYHVLYLAVHPDYRRRGIAERLCREAERIMYHEGGRGYVGYAISEEVAQYYVRTMGVKLRRLNFRGWNKGNVVYSKEFSQSGRVDGFLLWLRGVFIRLMGIGYIGRPVEGACRNIDPLRVHSFEETVVTDTSQTC